MFDFWCMTYVRIIPVNRLINFPHRCYETIAALWDRLDVFLIVGGFAQCFAQCRDIPRETAFLDNRIRPDSLEQVILIQYDPMVFDEDDEGLQNLRHECDFFAARAQNSLIHIQMELAKLDPTLLLQ